MKLSVVIVNYNVKHFLEQCLHSVLKASAGLEMEIFVVDNASVDGSCHMVREKFPGIRLIENSVNKGFSAANNQAIRESTGEFVLLLNPDTVVEEETFRKTLRFMEENQDAGGVGVRMIDGKGRFLPESKRGLPTPWVAFYKIFGISGLFSRSKKFGRYHLTYLNDNQIHAVDVLCGAFMMLRAKALEKTGLLDETFFMYGEDIDLSYRIIKAGYRNYYFPETTIIHYKGESTKKDSINYVKVFYNAMIIFARKHFSHNNALFFSFLIRMAIWFRAAIAISQRIVRKIYLPVIDALLIYTGMLIILPLWEKWRFGGEYYPDLYLQWVVPAYLLFWLSGIKISGGYRRPVSLLKLERGVIWGAIALLISYSLLPEEWRFSRAMILMGTIWALIILPFSRLIFSKLKISGFELDIEKQKRIAIAGHSGEVARVKELLGQLSVRPVIAGYVALSEDDTGADYLGSVDQLREIIRINRIDEIIFCGANLSSGNIIRAMLDLTDLDVDYKIAPPESLSIIGSNSIHTAGDLYLVSINAISSGENRKKKRILDFLTSFILLLSFFILAWFVKAKKQLLLNILQVMAGRISWVGYAGGEKEQEGLPVLKKSVLNPSMHYSPSAIDSHRSRQLDILYAKDYSVWGDLELIVNNLNKLDTEPNG